MRVLGYRRRTITTLLLGESVVIGVAGGLPSVHAALRAPLAIALRDSA